MPYSDPRFTIHNPSVQQIPPSYEAPKKKLSHAVKATPSAQSSGVLHPIPKRKIILGGFIGGKMKIGLGSSKRKC